MFGIDGTEYLVILIVALVFIAPKDLPKVMRKIGQWVGKARAMADQFKRSFDDMARQSELDELRAEVNRLKRETTAQTEAEINSAIYDTGGYTPPPRSHLEEVGAAPPKAEQDVAPASPAVGSPEAPPPQTDTSAKLAETALGPGG